MSENTEEFTDTASEVLETEDVVDNTENDECDIESLIIGEKEIEIPIIDKDKRISKNQMTKYELIRIIGERTAQLTRGAKPLIKKNKKSEDLSYKEIAIEEVKLNMIPFKIKRPVGNHYEIWDISELRKDHLMNILN